MKNKIVFIVGVLFAANAGYSEVPYNQNVRAKCPYIYSVESGYVFGESGIIGDVDAYGAFKSNKFSGQVDCYGLVHDSNGKILGSVMKKGEMPVYSKNQDESRKRLLYFSRPKADGSGVIVRTFDGSEFEPNGKDVAAEKEVDRWYTNWTILRNMENVFVNDICKKECENGFQVTSDFRIENTTTESKKDSVTFDVAENAKAIIHNHPKRNNESHAWPSLGDIISGLRNPNIDFYIVDCYDKATLIRFDQNTGKVHKIEDAGRETIAVNLEPDFQKEPAYKELMEKIDKVSTLEELEDLLAKKPSEGTGYNHAYLHMPYVPADFELLKKKVMSLRAAEKNKSGTLQNASSEVGNGDMKAVVAKTDADEAKDSNDKGKTPESVTVEAKDDGVDLPILDIRIQGVIKAITILSSCMKEHNAAIDLVQRSLPKRAMNDVKGIIADGRAVDAERAKYEKRIKECILSLNVSFLEMEKEFEDDSVGKLKETRKNTYNTVKPHIIKLFEILRDSPDVIRDIVEQVIPIQLARFLVNNDNKIRNKYLLKSTFGVDFDSYLK